ncbi:MAG: methylthioadenosine phosphorylase [Candidatus Schekmanbacteria bacterium RBG_13_48_7]|uniref:S-methyl-5'-thioadenosine phosphorylase n=1 Tax=Candidatus Schekmanbacteria bacterium RBG_13_48_7 TaxID=1817878 RepID=A0A1F7RU73_9BACT|nr:MAG: methylthioadenosine phosphorylase [Candidatus Schekmanbacteria bacterium RBG_13_48_7]
MEQIRIAIIGGSGLYQIEGIEIEKELEISTPFGNPSEKIVVGRFGKEKVAFLPRHGKGHVRNPSKINYRANIYALKSLGVEQIIAVGAVGSLKEEIKPGHFVFPDQIIDKTTKRISTFFDEITVHVGFSDPFCDEIRNILKQKAHEMMLTVHDSGTYVCMEGPQFSTRAESNLHRSWGASLIGMTVLPEAKLAREAEICYATIAIPTDYDCWYTEEHVSVEAILDNLNKSLNNTKSLIRNSLQELINRPRNCMCSTALNNALLTQPDYITKDKKQDLNILIGKYFH